MPAPRPGHAAWLATLALMLPLLTCATAAKAAGEVTRESAATIVMQGSTTFYSRVVEPNRARIEALSGRRLDVVANKSIHGLMALLEQRADLAMISSTIDAELDLIHKRRPELAVARLQVHEIATTRIAFARHPANPVSRLTLDQLRAVFEGRIGNWKELGGPDLVLVVATVQPGGGVPSTVRAKLLDGRSIAAQRVIQVEAPRHVLKVVQQVEGALGLTQLGLLVTSGLPEIATDAPVSQALNVISLGAPNDGQRAVIEALRIIAAEQPE